MNTGLFACAGVRACPRVPRAPSVGSGLLFVRKESFTAGEMEDTETVYETLFSRSKALLSLSCLGRLEGLP